jgi:hypothetical protein
VRRALGERTMEEGKGGKGAQDAKAGLSGPSIADYTILHVVVPAGRPASPDRPPGAPASYRILGPYPGNTLRNAAMEPWQRAWDEGAPLQHRVWTRVDPAAGLLPPPRVDPAAGLLPPPRNHSAPPTEAGRNASGRVDGDSDGGSIREGSSYSAASSATAVAAAALEQAQHTVAAVAGAWPRYCPGEAATANHTAAVQARMRLAGGDPDLTHSSGSSTFGHTRSLWGADAPDLTHSRGDPDLTHSSRSLWGADAPGPWLLVIDAGVFSAHSAGVDRERGIGRV